MTEELSGELLPFTTKAIACPNSLCGTHYHMNNEAGQAVTHGLLLQGERVIGRFHELTDAQKAAEAFNTRTPTTVPTAEGVDERAAFEKLAASKGWRINKTSGGNYLNNATDMLWEAYQSGAALRQQDHCAKGLPKSPAVGDGRIWSGTEWLEIAPSMETYAMLRLHRQLQEATERPSLLPLLEEAMDHIIGVTGARQGSDSHDLVQKIKAMLGKE